MKIILMLSLLVLSLSSVMAQEEYNDISKDLKRLKSSRVGGGGNGGGDAALNISREINRRAIEMGIRNSSEFRAKYKILVGKYNFCGTQTGCQISAKYFSEENALLVDRSLWFTENRDIHQSRVDSIIQEISHDD